MSAITATLTNDNGSLQLPAIEKQFLHAPLENAVDIQTLDGNIYTDFTSQKASWEFNYDSLTEDEYDAIRAFYDAQFTLLAYPLLSIPFYSLTNRSVRMYINEKDIWNNCGAVQNVKLTFRETDQLPEVS
jgi:hypothetical protein